MTKVLISVSLYLSNCNFWLNEHIGGCGEVWWWDTNYFSLEDHNITFLNEEDAILFRLVHGL